MGLSIANFQVRMHKGLARLFNKPFQMPGGWIRAYFESIYGLALVAQPDLIIDVGTERGISAMALALALKSMGKSPDRLTTIDIDHTLWFQLPDIHATLLEDYDLRLQDVCVATGNFCDLDPLQFLPCAAKVMIFYDIHDYFQGEDWTPSGALLDSWLPQIRNGLVLVDNMYPCQGPVVEAKDVQHIYEASRGKHWCGQCYYGFHECGAIIQWLNQRHGQLMPIPKAKQAFFLMREGRPL